MKAYTDITQSKKLAKILPIESADMQLFLEEDYCIVQIKEELQDWGGDCTIPCWSLAALLKELPETMLGKDNDGYVVMVETMGSGLTTFASNPVDACYEMIIKLKERNLI